MEYWWNDNDIHGALREDVSVPLCSPQNSHGLTWDRPIAWAMERLFHEEWKIVAYFASRSTCNTSPCTSAGEITVDSAVATKGSN